MAQFGFSVGRASSRAGSSVASPHQTDPVLKFIPRSTFLTRGGDFLPSTPPRSDIVIGDDVQICDLKIEPKRDGCSQPSFSATLVRPLCWFWHCRAEASRSLMKSPVR